MERKTSRFGSFLRELGRRHVGRVAIAYAAAAFILLQTGEIILPAFEAPAWGLRVLVLFVLLGFPVAVVLAWVYEITPGGIRRQEDIDPQALDRRSAESLMPRLAFLGLTLATAVAVGFWMIRWTVPEEAVDTLAPAGAPVGLSSGPIRSLAVLPLGDFSENPQDYFTAGMHEALIYQLSQIEALRVVSRTSAMRYAETTKTAPEIAAELGVEGIIEGSVLRAGDRVQITVQLIHGPTDRHIWANTYERELEDIISLQREVARAIAEEIQAELSSDERTRLAMGPPVDPEAIDAYARGRYEQEKGTQEALEAAMQFFEIAVEKDSSFAPAFTALAGTQILIAMGDSMEFEIPEIAVRAVERAVVLNPDDAETQAVVTAVHSRLVESQDLLVQERRLLAVNLDSLGMPSQVWLARHTEFGRQMEKLALERAEVAMELLPPHLVIGFARRKAAAGDHSGAERILRELLDRHPEAIEAWEELEHVYTMRGDYAGAAGMRQERAVHTRAAEQEAAQLVELERAVAERGSAGYWEWRWEDLKAREALGEPISHVAYAEASVVLGEYDEAIERLERAYDARDPHLLSLRSDPAWDPIRGDPRFRELLRKIRRARWEPQPRR